MVYRDPGRAFIGQIGSVKSDDDILRYVDFLRRESGLSVEPPIDLSILYACFDIPVPVRASIPAQGLLVNPDVGLIMVNEDDPVTRQRFTEGHEIIELLFAALPNGRGWAQRQVGGFSQDAKERLCNIGSAELLMPRTAFLPRIRRQGTSFPTAKIIAREFGVSLTASLVQMVRTVPGRHSVVVWRMKNKPTELQSQSVPGLQWSLFGNKSDTLPPQQLRVEWSMSGPGAPYIPADKSVSRSSSIFKAWNSGEFTTAKEMLDICRDVNGYYVVESQPFTRDARAQVLSLLHYPGDHDCLRGRGSGG